MQPKLHVKSGDMVEVTAGNDRGLRGRILRAMPDKERVVVEGVNMRWKHLRRSREHPEGGRIRIEAPIHASNVMLTCQNDDCDRYDRPVRTRTLVREDGSKGRECVKCGAEIPAGE